VATEVRRCNDPKVSDAELLGREAPKLNGSADGGGSCPITIFMFIFTRSIRIRRPATCNVRSASTG